MGNPTVNITIEPSEGNSVVYLPLAAPNSNGNPAGQLSLVFRIENPDSPDTVNLHLNKIEVLLPPSSYPFDVDLNIDKGSTGFWNTIVSYPEGAPPINQNIILPIPPPDTMTINLHFDSFSDPATKTKSLIPYSNKIPEGSYAFPGTTVDLDPGEFWVGRSSVHGSGDKGIQLFAYDMGVIGWDSDRNSWQELLPGTKELQDQQKLENTHYRIWRKPVYAMADGEVYECRNDRPDNPNPGRDPPEYLPESVGPLNGCGNYFSIKHGNEIVNYYHLRNGSVNTQLCYEGAQVHAGDLLGEVGNSGTSSNPHLHIHAIKGTYANGFLGAHLVGSPLPICFHNISVLEQGLLEPGVMIWNMPWMKVDGQGLSAARSAIWPGIIPPSPDIAYKWEAFARIIFGIIGGGGGLWVTPGYRPLPPPPPDPLRAISTNKVDVLIGLALTELASLAYSDKSKKIIQEAGIKVIEKGIAGIKKDLNLQAK